jgi:Uri superfamily endonuclease
MKGIYILIINIDKTIQTNIGAQGPKQFEKGTYAYVGSAQNNLEKRVRRHLKKRKKKFWHIDYLLNNKHTKITKILWKNAPKPEECKISAQLNRHGEPIPNFGNSDCNCKGHLYRIRKHQFLKDQTTEIPIEHI